MIKALFWPLVVGLFVVYFKEEIRDRLRNLKSLEAPGTKLGFDDALATQQKQIGVETEPALSLTETKLEFEKEKAAYLTSPTVKAISSQIQQDIDKSPYTKEEIMDIGVLNLAKVIMIGDFWRIYNFIFGSQLALLQQINTQPISKVDLIAFYSAVKQKFPDAFHSKDSNAYARFLLANELLIENKNEEQSAFLITNKGREFLIWCIESNLSFSKPF